MKKALTTLGVSREKPPKKGQKEIFDKGYPGLCLRVSYGGQKSWSYFFRLNGNLHRMGLGQYPSTSLSEARDAWREARDTVAKGQDPRRKKEASTGDVTAEVRKWLDRELSKKKSFRQVERLMEREVIAAWGERPIKSITRGDVRDLIDGIVDRDAVVMARVVHGYVFQFFKWCVGRGDLEVNPAADLPKPGSAPERDRVLEDDELAAIWGAAESIGWPFGTAIQLMILTGARRGEISGLEWSQVKPDRIELSASSTKKQRAHLIPLSSGAVALLEAVPRVAGSPFVFTTTGRVPIAGWDPVKNRLDKLSGVTDWRIHDLRRTVATGLERLGTPLAVTEAVLGHVSGSKRGVIGVYQRHDYANEKRSALEAWGSYVTTAVEGRELGKVLPLRGAS